MGKKSRFLNIPYLINTLVIKTKAIQLGLTKGRYPYAYFENKTKLSSPSKYELNYLEEYSSLAYLDFKNAQKYHNGKLSITQELILGLIYYNDFINNQVSEKEYLIELALKLKEKAKISDKTMTFYFDETYHRFDLNGKYYSGIVQGKAASFFLRCYSLTNEEKYKEWAKKCLLAAWTSVEEGGVLVELPHNNVWIEEYPSPKPSMVLNGFLFYIIGLAEYLTFEEDDDLQHKLEMCLHSVTSWMPNYKLKNGLLYSMYRWSLCNVHYTGIMKYQFEHLYQLTGVSIFHEYAEFTNRLTDWEIFDQIKSA